MRPAEMRALFVIHNPAFGGGYNEILVQRAGLEAAGWELLAATCAEPSSGADRLSAAGIDVTRLALHRLRATARPGPHLRLLAGFAPEVASLRRVIRDRAIDLVQVHGESNIHGAFAARLERRAVCFHLYDTRAPAALRRGMRPVVTTLAGSVTVTGQGTARAYPGLERLGSRLVITFPPVDPDRFRPDPEQRTAARAELGLPADELVIGAVGMRTPAKGHDLLIEAAVELFRAHPGMQLVILGGPSPGHLKYELALHESVARPQLEDRIRFLDAGPRVPELLPAMDILVMPSRGAEGMPTAILEAMACGLPVVATDIAAVREEVEDGVSGLVVPPGDAGALQSAIETLANDSALRARMGAVGRARVTEMFTPQRAVANRLRAWELALAQRRR
jgi:glycosyltransferase involved in cell wall biosynthesis